MNDKKQNLPPLAGKVKDAAAMVAYQEGAVVSRTLIDQQVGTITLFAFSQDQGLSEHISPYDAFVYVLEGKGCIAIAQEEQDVKKGEFLIMPAGVPHALRAREPFKMMLVMIRPKRETS